MAVDAITQMTNKATPKKKMKPRKKKNVKQEVVKLKLQRYLQRQREQGSLQPGAPQFSEADFDDEEILMWAEKLDVDDYRNDWDTIGTTGPSSKLWWHLDEDTQPHDKAEESSDSEIDEAELLRLIG
jgi:hypothetical protein